MTAITADIATTRVPRRTLRNELRAVKTVWRREMIRFAGNRMQVVLWSVQPLLFLFVLGSGLQSLSAASTEGVNLKTFMFPGVICMGVIFTSFFSAASIVWDRELGFLREMTVAPVSRTSILLGKTLGGATTAVGQGMIVVALAGLVDVPYDPLLILGVFGLLILISFTLTAFGVLVAVSIKQTMAFTGFMQLLVMPMFFISGALYPVSGLPTWLGVLNRVDPVTYAVDPMRRLVFDHLDVSASAQRTLDPGVTWWGWHLPTWFEVVVVMLIGLALMSAAIWKFSRTE